MDPDLPAVRLVVMSRSEVALPGVSKKMQIGCTDDESIGAYLDRRGIRSVLRGPIARKAAGNWLIARLLADLASISQNVTEEGLPQDLVEIYDSVLRQVGATQVARWQNELCPVLGVLAVAGVGPVLPLNLLCAASEKLGGPFQTAKVRDILVGLRGYVVRGQPGTEAEHVGLFHQTFAEYFLNSATGEFGIESKASRRALVSALTELAPVEQHDILNPLHRYAAAAEAEHFWALDKYSEALISLIRRESNIPAENLSRWKGWFKRVEETFGPDHLNTLSIRGTIAAWTGDIGDSAKALRLFEELFPDQERVLGPDCPGTLFTRHNLAGWTEETGDAPKALRLFKELLLDQERVLGPNHPDTLQTRHDIARCTGRAFDPREALRLFEELLHDRERVLGPNHPGTLSARHSVAGWTGETGDAPKALRLFEELLHDQERVLGPNHRETLRTRHNIAYWTQRVGDAPKALRLFEELLPDRERVLGPNHQETLLTRHSIAYWTGETGDAPKALRLFEELLPDRERVLGPNHRETLRTRHSIAHWTARAGDVLKALRLFEELLSDRERVLGPNHLDTLRTRDDIGRLELRKSG